MERGIPRYTLPRALTWGSTIANTPGVAGSILRGLCPQTRGTQRTEEMMRVVKLARPTTLVKLRCSLVSAAGTLDGGRGVVVPRHSRLDSYL